MITTLVGQPVLATGGIYGWQSCNWQGSGSIPNGTVEVRATGYPADGWGDGVLNSFSQRINASIADWDAAMAAKGWVYPSSISRIPDNWTGEDVHVYQHEFGSSELWGDALRYTSGGTSVCVMHSVTNHAMIWVRVRTDIHSSWFVQDDSRRVFWEECGSRGYTPEYTCSKNRDFESLLTHELGHALGISHPSTVDSHQPTLDPNAGAVANCGVLHDQATMCQAQFNYKSSGRTLAPWDLESLRLIEVKH